MAKPSSAAQDTSFLWPPLAVGFFGGRPKFVTGGMSIEVRDRGVWGEGCVRRVRGKGCLEGDWKGGHCPTVLK